MAQGPTRPSSSLSSTLVSPRSLKPCVCLGLEDLTMKVEEVSYNQSHLSFSSFRSNAQMRLEKEAHQVIGSFENILAGIKISCLHSQVREYYILHERNDVGMNY